MPWGLGNRRRRCTQLADGQGQGADHQEAGLASGRRAGRSALRARRRLLRPGARVHSAPHTVCTHRHAHLHALSSHAHTRVRSCTLTHTLMLVRAHVLTPVHIHVLAQRALSTHTHTHTHTHTGEHSCEDTSALGVRGRRPRSWRKHPLGVSAAHKRLLCYRKRGVACRELDPHAGRGVLARGSFLVGQWECGADGCFQCF